MTDVVKQRAKRKQTIPSATEVAWEFVYTATPQDAAIALQEVIDIVMRYGEEHGFFEEPYSR